jgi:hypothetical protein
MSNPSSSGGAAPAPLDESVEFRLYSSAADRGVVSDMEELYAIFVTCEHLEGAFIRDAVPRDQYRMLCTGLISKSKQIIEARGWSQVDVERFLEQYQLRGLLKAYRRLMIDRVDATALHGSGEGGAGAGAGGGGGGSGGGGSSAVEQALKIHETTAALITALDSVKMLSAVDELLPAMRAVSDRLNDIATAPADWRAREKILDWLRRMSAMRASDALGDDDRRQVGADLEAAYDEYTKLLRGGK